MEPLQRVLIIDTSGRVGCVALGESGRIVDRQMLSESRRHARDLPARTNEMMAARGWMPSEIESLIVCIGPGSYTGLRVGVAAAKAFAFATGCTLYAVPLFDVLAHGIEPGEQDLAIVSDALQSNIYAATYRWTATGGWMKTAPLSIVALSDWTNRLKPGTWVTGPGVEMAAKQVGREVVILEKGREATAEQFFSTVLGAPEEYRSSAWQIDPIYLRGSSAEEKRNRAVDSPDSRSGSIPPPELNVADP